MHTEQDKVGLKELIARRTAVHSDKKWDDLELLQKLITFILSYDD